jgi:hypothetical protein
MNTSQQKTTNSGKKLKIKLQKSKKKVSIEKKINDLYPNSDLFKKELTYDLDIDEEFKKHLTIDGEEPDINLINNLPKLSLETQIIEDNDADDPDETTENKESDDDIEDDIDKDALELETVGSKKYYLDYSKGIIYDLQYKPIGNIDEFGEINID